MDTLSCRSLIIRLIILGDIGCEMGILDKRRSRSITGPSPTDHPLFHPSPEAQALWEKHTAPTEDCNLTTPDSF
jgi:hypothetical protein